MRTDWSNVIQASLFRSSSMAPRQPDPQEMMDQLFQQLSGMIQMMAVLSMMSMLGRNDADSLGGEGGNGSGSGGGGGFSPPPSLANPTSASPTASPLRTPELNVASSTQVPPAGSTTVAAQPGSTVGAPSVNKTAPPNSITPALREGVDNQAALQNAFDTAKREGKSVWIPEGKFDHSGVLKADGIKVEGAGDKSELHATNPDQSAIELTGSGGSISNLKASSSPSGRSSQPEAALILVRGATDAKVSGCSLEGGASNSLRLDNANNTTVSHNVAAGSSADGIAICNNSHGNNIESNVVSQSGDDGISDNSYTWEAQSSGNSIKNNLVMNPAYGRGICAEGSKDGTITGNTIVGSNWVGIAAQTDGRNRTHETSGHNIQGNTFVGNDKGPMVMAAGGGMNVGANTVGSAPDLASVLGWNPGVLQDRRAYNSSVPGTGDGANNDGTQGPR
jgi:parallel beta-helix repeat protein